MMLGMKRGCLFIVVCFDVKKVRMMIWKRVVLIDMMNGGDKFRDCMIEIVLI